MAVLEKEAGGGLATDRAEAAERPVVIRGSGLRTQLLVGLAALAIGVGGVIGANGLGLTETDRLSPAQIARSDPSTWLRTWRAGTGRSLPRRTCSAPGPWRSPTPVGTKRGSTGSTSSAPRTWSPSTEGGREEQTRS